MTGHALRFYYSNCSYILACNLKMFYLTASMSHCHTQGIAHFFVANRNYLIFHAIKCVPLKNCINNILNITHHERP